MARYITTCGTPASAVRPIIALMPGSRRGEIRNNLPIMREASDRFPRYRAIIIHYLRHTGKRGFECRCTRGDECPAAVAQYVGGVFFAHYGYTSL